MPSRAAYTALAAARSDTGCSTVLIPWVEEPVMVTPEVVGHIDPVCTVVFRRTARREIDSRHHKSTPRGVGGRRLLDDGRAGLVGRADRDPAHPVVSDVVADLEAEGVAIEGQGCARVVMREEARVNGDVHGDQAR